MNYATYSKWLSRVVSSLYLIAVLSGIFVAAFMHIKYMWIPLAIMAFVMLIFVCDLFYNSWS